MSWANWIMIQIYQSCFRHNHGDERFIMGINIRHASWHVCVRLCAQNVLQVVGTILNNQELIISSRLGAPNWNIMDTATHAHSFSHTHVSSLITLVFSIPILQIWVCRFSSFAYSYPSSDCFLPPDITFQIEASKNIIKTMVIVWWLICTLNDANSLFIFSFLFHE